jgi:serine/threonine protein kinase
LVGPPPENGNSEYSDKVDIWSLGCILYEVSLGRPPFHDEINTLEYSQSAKLHELLSARVLEIELYGKAGKTVQRIIREMLEVEPFKRPSAKDVNTQFQLFGSEDVNNETKGGETRTSANTEKRSTLSY